MIGVELPRRDALSVSAGTKSMVHSSHRGPLVFGTPQNTYQPTLGTRSCRREPVPLQASGRRWDGRPEQPGELSGAVLAALKYRPMPGLG